MTTATGITRQQVASLLNKAGFVASVEGRNGRIGFATRSFGYSVTDNGERVYSCKSCGGRDSHNGGCRTRSGAAKFWQTRVVKDGTVTVTIHGRTTTRVSDSDRVESLAEQVVATLISAGLTVTADDSSRFTYIVSN
jgi:hypothetical protein